MFVCPSETFWRKQDFIGSYSKIKEATGINNCGARWTPRFPGFIILEAALQAPDGFVFKRGREIRKKSKSIPMT